jgi:1-deoxy-D-xylulose-5-phosphate synthase
VFDLTYLRHLPNMVVMAPKDENELQHMLLTSVNHDGPSAVRYPRGNGYGVPLDQHLRILPIGKAELLRNGVDGLIIAVGTMVYPCLEVAEMLAKEGVNLAVVNARFIKPLDNELIIDLIRATNGPVFTAEENAIQGGFGSAILELIEECGFSGIKVIRIGYPDSFIEQGEQADLRSRYGLDQSGIEATLRNGLNLMVKHK